VIARKKAREAAQKGDYLSHLTQPKAGGVTAPQAPETGKNIMMGWLIGRVGGGKNILGN